MNALLSLLCLLSGCLLVSCGGKLPMVINTWAFVDANKEAAESLKGGESTLDAVEKGCSVCEMEQCDGSVGFGGSPDEKGETTLDAMIMDGEAHRVGAVGCLKEVKGAISVARSVMTHTSHTLLVGDDATNFAVEMGFKREDLHTDKSKEMHEQWLNNKCQPNYWNKGTVVPDPTTSCGPYNPAATTTPESLKSFHRPNVDQNNHDTIGMIAIDADGRMACGTSTNGLTNKIPGRVGDTPIAGAGCYVVKGVGGAAATGDGDVMMRFLPAYRAVESMRNGSAPTAAALDALNKIIQFYPSFSGALVTVNATGDFGAANHGFSSFSYTVYNPTLVNSTVITLP